MGRKVMTYFTIGKSFIHDYQKADVAYDHGDGFLQDWQ